MKGIVVDCLKSLVSDSLGTDKWKEIMILSDVSPDKQYRMVDDIDDELVLKMFGKTCEVGQLSFEQACDAYGDYWVNAYMPKLYPDFYIGVKSAKQFLMKLDEIHATMTKKLENAKPPRHQYQWRNGNTLVMSYDSERGLIDLFIGAVKGVARFYEEEVQIRKIDEQRVEINFEPDLAWT